MAARRISKSAVDWAAFAERVPPNQKQFYQALKAKSDGYLRRVLSMPENPPPIDFAMYRAKLGNPALVEQFEKSYKAFSVPFPKEHVTPDIDAQEQSAKKEVENFISESNNRIAGYKKELARFEAMIPALHMTMEDFVDYFPDQKIDVDNPTYWPHDGSTDFDDSLDYADKGEDH
ncbi:ATP synthase subunit d, mitochondrial [Dermacentor albipictus]|uniref:ATP synthase subunit d, mitochondrial n=1 Tax=Dermacentor albipictus TaxID=60249 RepID=UPI0038FD0D34